MINTEENILDRMWCVFNTNIGIFFLYCGKKYRTEEFIYRSLVTESPAIIESISKTTLLSSEYSARFAARAGADASGFIFPQSAGAFLMEEWNYNLLKARISPYLIYERDFLGKTKINCIVTSNCIDSLYTSRLPKASEIYFNQSSLTKAYSFPLCPKAVPLANAMTSKKRNAKIIDESKRFLLECRHGKPAPLAFIKENELTGGEVEYILLHSLRLHPDEIEKLGTLNMEWNRTIQAWVGWEKNVDIDGIRKIISRDKVPTKEQLGFVPEWYSSMIISERLAEQRKYGRIKKEETILSNRPLWDQIL